MEKRISDYLVSKNIFPFSVLFVEDPCFLKLSFYLPSDLDDLLKIIRYNYLCDTSEVEIIREENTILLGGLGLISFLRDVNN